MKIKSDFPYPIRELENCWIPLSTGIRLAARLWLPVGAEADPVPALLEYLPYRKSDGTACRDALRHPYLAGHGYACVRVDIRGTGDSEGILYDEYLPQEQEDALELLRWIAAQPWCNGSVGMFGISWGGFNSLQIAARRPPELKAIITVCSTDDRYADDVHYMGGCVLGYEMLAWASVMLAYNAAPPDPRFSGDNWRKLWFERLEKTPPYSEAWLSRQRRDAYWKHGSVCEDFSAITIPVFVVGGWADGYTNAIPRLLAGLSVPKKGLIGPWAHNYPEEGSPGPAIGFLQESLRWWDYWLKGIETGIMAEPLLRSWIQESQPPRTYYAERPGRWVADLAWPSPQLTPYTYTLNAGPAASQLDGLLAASPHPPLPLQLRGSQTTGIETGPWTTYALPGDYPANQQADDGKSLVFTSAALEAPVDILGLPQARLTVAVDQPLAFLAVRLCEVAPDGSSTLVSWGVLNLTHRDSHEFPTPLSPGEPVTVTIPLNMIGYRLPAGHRWRLALSPTHWPLIWPSPWPVTVTLFTGEASQLILPVRQPHPEDGRPHFCPPEGAAPLPIEVLRQAQHQRRKSTDLISGKTEVQSRFDFGRIRVKDNGVEYEDITTNIYTIHEDDPLSAMVRCDQLLAYHRDKWQVRLETSSTMTASATHFHLTHLLDAYEGQTRVFTKSWSFTIPRDL
jgi:putative CocE/NonD family hydrolase